MMGKYTVPWRAAFFATRQSLFIAFLFLLIFYLPVLTYAQDKDIDPADIASGAIFDDRALLDGYEQKYANEPENILLAMIGDDSLGSYKCTAAVHEFKENFANEVLSADKPNVLHVLIRRLDKSDSPFVQVEIMHTLVILDRYQYFDSMVPALILKIEHYNPVVSEMAYHDVWSIVKGSYYTREARIVFNTVRKMLFLSRNRLANVTKPDRQLSHELDLLRWSIKILGTQELKRLPPEVINLL